MNEIKEIMKMIDDALTQNYSLWDFSFDIGEYLNDNFE